MHPTLQIIFNFMYLTTSITASLTPFHLTGNGRLLTAILFYRELASALFASVCCSNVQFLLAIFKEGDSVQLTHTRHI